MREMKKIFAGILMTVLLTGCSSQEILSEVPQTIVLPEEQIDSLPMQEEDPTSADTENTESFSLLEEGGSRFAYESLEAPEQIWYLEIEQALGEMEGTVKLSTDPLEQGLDEQDIDKIFYAKLKKHAPSSYLSYPLSIFNFSVIRTASTASRTSCTRRMCAPFINATVSNTVVPFNESCGVPPNNL